MTLHAMKEEEVRLLREEIELLMSERRQLLQVTGAAAVFVANLDTDSLPDSNRCAPNSTLRSKPVSTGLPVACPVSLPFVAMS